MFRFTVGEALRKGTLIFYFSISTLILLLMAIGSAYSGNTSIGDASALTPENQEAIVINILIFLHSASSFWIIILGIVGIVGLIPSMLEKGTIDLFLSKPLNRLELLMARALGAIAGIALNLLYFFAGIWLIFGLKLGVWQWGFLSSVLYLIFAFVCLFSISTLAGLLTRSAGFSIIITLIYCVISWILEIRERGLFLFSDNVVYRYIVDGLYYITPQFNAMLSNSTLVIGKSPLNPYTADFTYLPFVYSFFSTSLIYLLSIWYFSRQDY